MDDFANMSEGLSLPESEQQANKPCNSITLVSVPGGMKDLLT